MKELPQKIEATSHVYVQGIHFDNDRANKFSECKEYFAKKERFLFIDYDANIISCVLFCLKKSLPHY